MNRIFAALKDAIWSFGGGYGDLCERYGLPVLLTAGVMGLVAALVHATPGQWLLFAGVMATGSAIVQVILWYPGRTGACECDSSCEEDSA